MSAAIPPVNGAVKPDHRADIDSLRASLLSSHQGDFPTVVHVSARFLPYDDLCRLKPARGVGHTDERNETKQDSTTDQSAPCSHRLPRSPSALSQHPIPPTSCPFFSQLLAALGATASDGAPGAEHTVETAREQWSTLFAQWPLELAASGYAEWWLRHPWCPEAARPLLEELLGELTKVEHYRRRHRSDGRDTCGSTPAADEASAHSRDLRGAVRMLLAVYAHIPHSLRDAFENAGENLSFNNHHRLFFLACRLGAYRQQGVNEDEDAVDLGLFLSLAAVIAHKISGTRLEMRGDLMRFLGRVSQNWENLLKHSSEEELVKDYRCVESLFLVATDKIK